VVSCKEGRDSKAGNLKGKEGKNLGVRMPKQKAKNYQGKLSRFAVACLASERNALEEMKEREVGLEPSAAGTAFALLGGQDDPLWPSYLSAAMAAPGGTICTSTTSEAGTFSGPALMGPGQLTESVSEAAREQVRQPSLLVM
jgi:hypothetical protein